MDFMAKLVVVVAVAAASLGVIGCGSGKGLAPSGSGGVGGSGPGGAGGTAGIYQIVIPSKINTNLDILFMIKNSSSTTLMQQKLMAQLPTFLQVLQQLPTGLPNLHIAVVSLDMGAPGDSTSSIGCTSQGDNGQFRAQPTGTCTSTTLSAGSTFLSDVDGQTNFTDPIDKVLQCITLLGSNGCGFEHPLASIVRALGADGQAPPASNANFLRPDAYLGIIILSNEDDCSAPANTTLYSLNGSPQSLTNPLGPIANYRCNQFGHLCQDPATGTTAMPPLNPPSSATGNPPILNLANCTSNDTSSGMLTPVSAFIQQIKALKVDPDNQILVAAIAPPPDPYSVQWVPPAASLPGTSGQIWPEVMHSCGAAGGDDVNPASTMHPTDGTFGDPAVRIKQFVDGFPDSVLASVCDASYAASMTAIATKLGELIRPLCLVGTFQLDSQAQPACTVTIHTIDSNGIAKDTPAQNCVENGGVAPCWTLTADSRSCPSGGLTLRLTLDPSSQSAASLNSTVACQVCQPGSTTPGC